ncbi:MAG: hypothetical protein ACJ8GN_26360, partial [Longimicrobiaceae bacterium]
MPNGDDRPMDTPPLPPTGDGAPRRRRARGAAPEPGILSPEAVREVATPAAAGRRARGRVNRAAAALAAAGSVPEAEAPVLAPPPVPP